MGDEPILRGSQDEVDPDIAELLLDEEEGKSNRRWIIIIIIIILLLLLLFWPVDRSSLRKEQSRGRRERATAKRERPIGRAKYTVISGGNMAEELPLNTRKGVAVGVWFYVENLSPRAEVLDYSMLQLRDQFGAEYAATLHLTERAYQEKQTKSPWGKRIPSGAKIRALVIFTVGSGPVKEYWLVGRDYDWASEATKEYKVGSFDTLPVNRYMPPDSAR